MLGTSGIIFFFFFKTIVPLSLILLTKGPTKLISLVKKKRVIYNIYHLFIFFELIGPVLTIEIQINCCDMKEI
jgi:ATP/ADP translocase